MTLKLILAIVEDDDATQLLSALVQRGFGATKLASTGGFLLRGNTTVLIGVEDTQVPAVLELIGQTCVRRRRLLPQTSAEIPSGITWPVEVETGGAMVFVLDVEETHKL